MLVTINSKQLNLLQCLPNFLLLLALVLPAISTAGTATNTDLDTIRQNGELRILYYLDEQANALPSMGAEDRKMVEEFAAELLLTPTWIHVDEQWQLIPKLIEGQGDIIIGQDESLAGGMTGQAKFTLPWVTSQNQVVVRTDTTQIKSLDDLFYRQIALKESSPAGAMLARYAEHKRSMDIISIPESLDQKTIMMRVASGQYDVTIADSEFLKTYLPKHPELSVAFDISKGNARAWAVRPDATELHTALNQFLNKNHLPTRVADIHLDDLPEMQKRRSLRIITYKSPANYYFYNGRFRGFEYELFERFTDHHNLQLDMVLAGSHAEMQQLLLSGRGDVIAASLSSDSITDDHIQLSDPYNYSAPVIIGRTSEKILLDIRDLEGRRIVLSPESPYRKVLERIRDRGIDFEIVTANPESNTKTTLFMVSMGMYDLTILGSHKLKAELADQVGIKAHFSLSEPGPHVWAVRSEDTRLLAAINKFVKNYYRGKTYNVLHERYFEKPIVSSSNSLLAQLDRLSPYDEIIRKYAEQYSFDWRLIVAQMYQESQFNPKAVSYAGAEGLMQILPTTGEYLGTDDLDDPKSSIKAGVKYLGMLRDRFEDGLLLEDRIWLSLAAYNAGYNRVKRARYLTEEMGLDKDRWFDNVEKAMLVLARPFKMEGKIKRHCRCGQTVIYVRNIRTLYNNYVRLTQATQLASSKTSRQFPYDI